MLKLGITGGIGSGKSTVCRIFEQLGVPVYNADTRARELIAENLQLRAELVSHFGPEAFADGIYNTVYMAGLVFQDQSKLALLNTIVHPYVFRDWEAFCQEHAASPYVVKEAAIMLETDSRKTVDKVILVYAPAELRLERSMKRDGSSREKVLARMASQMPEEEKLKLADGVIYNDGSKALIPQVLALHKQLISGN